MSAPDTQTIRTMHRWFAVECNNRGWDLTAQDGRSEAEAREMVLCAYAAAYHWSQVGEPINDARADTLLAQAHAYLDHGELALHHARRALGFCETHACEPWDSAFAHAVMAHAAAVQGDLQLRDRHHAEAIRQGGLLAEAEDRKIFADELGRIERRITG